MSKGTSEQIRNRREWLTNEIEGVEHLLRQLKNRRVFRAARKWRAGMLKHYKARLIELREELKSLPS